MEYFKSFEIRWADIDANNHVLHSKYYDYGAHVRISLFADYGVTMQVLAEYHIGPILFREECLFRKELHFGDAMKMNVEITKSKKDFSRWSMKHLLYKNEDMLAAEITVDGAWIDTVKRKLAIPPQSFLSILENAPKSADFVWL